MKAPLHRTATAARRLLLALTVALLAGALGLVLAAPANADDLQTPGVDRFGACVATQQKGRVLMLIDQSASLTAGPGATDREGARATAAKALAKSLSGFSASSGAELELAVSGFATDYNQELDWTGLSSGNLGAIDDAITRVADETSALNTDYQTALDGALVTMGRAGASAGQQQPCQMIVWFTDGELQFLDSPKTVEGAQEIICRPSGIADQLRAAGIVTVAIGLGADSDFALLKNIATGTGGCGEITKPVPGDFLPASDVDELLFAFDRLATPGQAPNVNEAGVCFRKVCDEGKHRFVLDSTIGNVTLLASAGTEGAVPVLVSPDGKTTELKDSGKGTTDIGGVEVHYDFPSDQSVSITMSNAEAPQWAGVWSLVFVTQSQSNAQSKSSMHISTGLRPEVKDLKSISWRSASTADVTFQVVDKSGAATKVSSAPGEVKLTAALDPATGDVLPVASLDKAKIGSAEKVDLDGVAPGAATLRMELTITTAKAKEKGSNREISTTLEPIIVDVPITIDPPAGYPTVPGTVNFGTLEGSGEQQVALPITGPGCVWLDSESVDFTVRPDGAQDATVTAANDAESNCLKLNEGEEGSLTLTLHSPEEVNGVVGGTLTLKAAPKDPSAETLSIPVGFNGTLAKPVDSGKFWLTLILALILGPLIPLLLLYLAKWWTSKIPASALRSAMIPVRISGGTVLRDGRPFEIRNTDLVQLVSGLNSPTRSLSVDGATLQTSIGKSPFGAGYVVASAPGMAGAGGRFGDTVGDTPDGKLPLAVHNHWVLFHDPNGPADAASILVLAGGDTTADQIDQQLTQQIRDNAGQVLTDLRAKAQTGLGESAPADAPAGQNPFGGPPPGGNPPGGNPFGGPGPSGPPPSGPPAGGNPFGGSGPSGPPPSGPPPSGPPAGANPFGGNPPSGPPPSGPPPGNPYGGNPFGGNPPSGPPPGGNPFA